MNQPIYLKVIWPIAIDEQEAHIGLFSQLPFESFEQQETQLIGYILQTEFDQGRIDQLQTELPGLIPDCIVEVIPNVNWNAEWESNFQPIRVNDFCGIRASFHHSIPDVQYEIVIDPKMAFGTGHHETTWMMIDQMSHLNFTGANVLDYGAGTAVLSILAEKLGAAHVDAIEIESPAVENAHQNVRINNCNKINVIEGDLSKVPSTLYQLILANINRNVILNSLVALHRLLDDNGEVLFSGILDADRQLVTDQLMQNSFEILDVIQRGEWLCIKTKKA